MITGVILARNEELNIVSCLEALRPHVAELFLIDMESSDQTVALARPYVDRVINHPLVSNFDAARNVAIPVATHDWLWFIDADEQVPYKTGQMVNELVRSHGNDFEAINIPFKTYFCGHWMEHNGWWPGYTCCRVMKRGHFEFSKTLHAGVLLSGRELLFGDSPDTGIVHNSFRSLHHYIEKFNRYTTVEAKQLHERGFSYHWRSAIRSMMHDLWEHYEHFSARRDGTWGWVVTWLAALYRWMSFAKLLDEAGSRGEPTPDSAPENLDELFQAMEDELASFRRLEPRLPLGLVIECHPNELTRGFPSAESRLLTLARLGRELQWRQTNQFLADQREPSVDPILWTLGHNRRPGHSISVWIGDITLAKPDDLSRYSVFWPIDDSFYRDLSGEWVATLRHFDAVWVSSCAASRRMRELGVAEEHLQVVPPWTDLQQFQPFGQKAQLTTGDSESFTVLAMVENAKPAVRQEILCGFSDWCESTGAPVTIVVGTDATSLEKDRCAIGSHQAAQFDDRLHVHTMDLPKESGKQAELIRSVDAVFLASPKNQMDWGMGALACGRPVIALDHEPPTGFEVPNVWFNISTKCNRHPGSDSSIDCDPSSASDSVVLSIELFRAAIKAVHEHRGSIPRLDVVQEIQHTFGPEAARKSIDAAIGQLEDRLRVTAPPSSNPNQLRVTIEGEVFARHSFANINETLADGFAAQPSIAVRIDRRFVQETFDDRFPNAHRIKPLLRRNFEEGPEITIRHAFPPNWEPLEHGLWVHIQPWEFGYLPVDWLPALHNQVTEVWAPSNYVRRVYVDSGINPDKVRIMRWGCDTDVFSPDAPPLLLPTAKNFRFLFVGGTIPRKGFDRLFDAYLAEFDRNDDVCLVVKDIGATSFYHDSTYRARILEAVADDRNPEIVYLADDFLPSQLASLYASCHCLVAPYRGEGFGLPVLEAMACGLPAVVPKGGPTDDFVSDAVGYRLSAREVPAPEVPNLCKPGLEFEVSVDELRNTLRRLYKHPEDVRRRGHAASEYVHSNWTWDSTVLQMTERLWQLAELHLGGNYCSAKKTKSDSHSQETILEPSISNEPCEPAAPPKLTFVSFSPGVSISYSGAVPSLRPGKIRAVLIQMGTGEHQRLLEKTRAHHTQYARRHGLDYWCAFENPAAPKRAGWGKITLLLRALREGFDIAVWLDADAVIMRPEINLAGICDRGVGLVQHPNPVHWNTGLLAVTKSRLVEQFLAELDSQPENTSAWMEQLAFNQLSRRPEYAALLNPLSPTFNSTPGALVAPQPVVWAAHGLPMDERVRLIEAWLLEASEKSTNGQLPTAATFHVREREEFADHLNALGLTNSAVEVGVLRGEFSRMFLDRWNGSQLHLIDPWRQLPGYADVSNLSDEAHEEALGEVRQTLAPHEGRYQVHRKLSEEAVSGFADKSLDFVYIDANHEYYAARDDIRRWFPKVRPGGILAGHDFVDGLYPEGEFGVRLAVREFEQQTGIKALSTEGRWNSWYLYRL